MRELVAVDAVELAVPGKVKVQTAPRALLDFEGLLEKLDVVEVGAESHNLVFSSISAKSVPNQLLKFFKNSSVRPGVVFTLRPVALSAVT
jgi:hypothetical protein